MTASEIKPSVADEQSSTPSLAESAESKTEAPAQERKPSTRVMRCDFKL